MKPIYLPIVAAVCLWPGIAAALPDCAGPVAAGAAVVRVERDGVLVLEKGRAAVLEGILLPAADDGPGARLVADRAFAALSRLAGQGIVSLAATQPVTDRYGRLRAQGFAPAWLQQALLEQGLARVMIAPDRWECAAELYAFEAKARAAGRGLWALPAYRVRAADAGLARDAGTFQIVEGMVANTGSGGGRSFIDFSLDWRHGFSAVIAGEDRKLFRKAGVKLASFRGHHIRLRGMVEDDGGHPAIALSSPAQIEMLD